MLSPQPCLGSGAGQSLPARKVGVQGQPRSHYSQCRQVLQLPSTGLKELRLITSH